jgi:mannose-6-phosphate isomerase-like protein (cupin superfamily)
MYVHSWENGDLTPEPAYNVRAKRLPKFAGAGEPYSGGAWVVVAPNTTMTEHVNPDGESEIFYIVGGSGTLEVAGEKRTVEFGDTIFIPPHQEHSLFNDGAQELIFLSLWWDTPSLESV